ncbi:MAG: hypothetical protein AAF362_10745, partial [Pseudomonadota bacterium]
KSGIGKSGVHLRYHTPEEYEKLNGEQRSELREWRLQNPEQKKRKTQRSGGRFSKKKIAAMVAKQLETKIKETSAAVEEQKDADAYIMLMVEAALAKKAGKVASASTDKVPALTKQVSLLSILKNAKN